MRAERAEFTFSVSLLLHTNRVPSCSDEYRYENLANISRAVGKNNKGDVGTRAESGARGVDMLTDSGGVVRRELMSGGPAGDAVNSPTLCLPESTGWREREEITIDFRVYRPMFI